MAVKEVATQQGINPQIIPMIDIMFLLLLFFMVGADMGQRELEDVRLPQALGVKEQVPTERPSLTVNCFHSLEGAVCRRYDADEVCADAEHWRIAIGGRVVPIDRLADALEPHAARARFDPQLPRLSESPVQIRADASALYASVQAVIKACQDVGIYKLEIGAASALDGAPIAQATPAASASPAR